jgi:hypothetical protein
VPAGARPWAVAPPADGVPRLLDESRSDAATRPHISEPATPPTDIDEGWGPPGTTIPPPFLGAVRGSEPDTPSGGAIPIAGDADAEDALDAKPLVLRSTDSEAVHAPHLVAPEPPPLAEPLQPAPPKVAPERPRVPLPVEPPPSAPISAHLVAADPIAAARSLEAASTRLVELLRLLDRAHTRDEVISGLLDYLHRSHDRVAFFASKNGALSPFLQRPASAQKPPSLPLETPSTLQDVVGTRLPYRGTLADDASRHFIAEVFGSEPAEVLILPIAVRDRVVAVLYGDGGHGQSFDEHFAIAGRAAGLALERILQAKRAATQP